MKIYRKTLIALAALSLLGAATLARAADVGDAPRPVAKERPADRTDQTVYRPAGTVAGTPERAAEDAFFFRHSGGVPG
jgi:Spy/CpxP family protein refolding chaperone